MDNKPIKLKIFAGLQQQDLACLSAKEAMSQLLNFDALNSLMRFQQWMLTWPDEAKIEDQVIDAAKQSLTLINPNKETLYIHQPPPVSPRGQVHYLTVKKRRQAWTTPDWVPDAKALGVQQVSAVLWVLDVEASISPEVLTERVVLSRSAQNGLLVNPLLETFHLSHGNRP